MNQIPNLPELSGSIVLERGTSFLSKQIILHMKLYAKMTGRKPLPYSHAETLLWHYAGVLYTSGERADGTELTRVSDYYHGQDILILKPKISLTQRENHELWRFYQTTDFAPYQKGNFLSWITYLKTGWWLSSKGAKKNYCYELAARFSHTIGRWPEGKSLDMVSIYDLYENENYEVYKP